MKDILAFPGKYFSHYEKSIVQNEEGRNEFREIPIYIEHPGMTLLDYFAAKTMQAFIATRAVSELTEEEYNARIAKWAYETASAMLREREKREGDK